MKITGISERAVPVVGAVANAVVNFSDHDVSLVMIHTDQHRDGVPLYGVAFNSIGRFAQSGIIKSRFVPRILAAASAEWLSEDGSGIDPARLAAIAMANEKPGGHGDRAGALAAVELAVWDLNARILGEPAWRLIARQAGRPERCAPVRTYAAGGYYYEHDSVQRLQTELRRYQAGGFNRFKLKVGGASLAEDLRRVDAATAVAGSAGAIMVDANGRFDHETAISYQRALVERGICWFEEPGDPLDYAMLASLAKAAPLPLATGENLFSLGDVKNLLQFGGLRPGIDVLQMDPGLSYGLTEYLKMLDCIEAAGFSRDQCVPHGGHLINLHIVAGLGLGGAEAYPGVFRPFGGFGSHCEIVDGAVVPPETPGFGLESQPELAPLIDEMIQEGCRV